MQDQRSAERGAVSIFIVIFFALLISVITMSFISIVIRGSTQSTNNDLSRSAYDSAQSGVEDAKRAIAKYLNECSVGGAQCGTFTSYINNKNCGVIPAFASSLGMVNRVNGTEVTVQDKSNNNFNQAYTCVNVTMDTPDYLNSTPEQQSDVIPLDGTAAFDSVNLNWFTHSDASAPSDTTPFTPRNTGVGTLPTEANWDSSGPYTPPLMRVELISYSGSINDANLQNDSRTVFLYPSTSGSKIVHLDAADVKNPISSTNGAPIVPVNCAGAGTYACNISLALDSNAGKTSFLRVTPIYKKATFQLQLRAGGSEVLFNAVQPIVDSTGRANDLYRRVEARVRLQNNITYPEFAIDSNTALCKDYSVGSLEDDFQNGCN